MSYTLATCEDCLKINRVPLGRAEAEEAVCGNCKQPLPVEHGVVKVTGTTLQRLLEKSSLPVLVDCWAPWCVPCRTFEPEYRRVAARLAGRIVFAKLDTQANALAASAYQIRSVPTLIFFQNGIEHDRLSGALSAEQLMGWLQSLEPKLSA